MADKIGAKKYLNKTNGTGSAGIATSKTALYPSRLISVTCNFNAAPTTSEDFIVTLNLNAGAAYDSVLYTRDPSSPSTKSIVWTPGDEIRLEPGDAIDVTYTNTDTRTYGVQITIEEFS